MDAKTLCLGVLSRGDASGYEIAKAFAEGPFGHIHETSFGSIYPALSKLHQEGLVACTAMAQEKRPDKKVYAITEAGRGTLVAALMAPPQADKMRSDFLFMLFLADLLPAAQVAALIDQRIAWYEESLARMEGCDLCDAKAGARFVHSLGLEIYAASAAYLKENRDALLAEISGTVDQAAE